MPKTCRTCQQTKDDSAFYRNRHNPPTSQLYPDCKSCHAILMTAAKKRRFAAHPEKRLAATRKGEESRRRNPVSMEKRRIQGRRRHQRNKIQWNKARAARRRAFRLEHPDAYRAQNLRYRLSAHYAAYMLAYEQQRYARDPERGKRYYHKHLSHCRARAIAKNHRRRTRLHLAARRDFSPEQWQEVLAAFRYRCAYCQRQLSQLEQEHITPVVAQGSYTLHNIVPACMRCNRRKATNGVPVPVQPLLLTMAQAKRR